MIYFLFSVFFNFFGTLTVPENNIVVNKNFHKSAPIVEEKKEEFKIPQEIIKKEFKKINLEIITPIKKDIKKETITKKELPIKIEPEKKEIKKIETPKTIPPQVPIMKLDGDKLKGIPALPTPEKVKGIYMTGYSLNSKKRRNELFNLIKETELNTVVVDIQDPDGNFMFPVQDEKLKNIELSKISFSREEFRGILDDLQKAEIYTIARITTFQDEGVVKAFPDLTLKYKSGKIWKNYKGFGWLDMTNQEAWEIPLKKAQESAKIGFDEIQFDYIRFPSDGIISQISYKDLGKKRKYQVMEEFFAFLNKNKSKIGVPISIDLFGANYAKYSNTGYDLSIGQRVIGAVKYFDYLSPMIYPSHYPSGHMGYKNPANFPYAVVHKSMYDGNKMIEDHTSESIKKSRPWLQAFNLGAKYDYQKIRDQIRAVDQNNASGWLLWSARNVYGQAF